MFSFEGEFLIFLWCSMKGLQHKQADLAEDTKCPIKPQISWFCFGQITKTPKHVQQFTVHLRPQKTNKQRVPFFALRAVNATIYATCGESYVFM